MQGNAIEMMWQYVNVLMWQSKCKNEGMYACEMKQCECKRECGRDRGCEWVCVCECGCV